MTEDLRLNVALSCRILGMMGLVSGSTGHVSARIPESDEMWLRCRGGNEMGVLFTGLHNVRRVDYDGNGPGLGDQHASPSETAIHGAIYRAHPQVGAVIHAHPPYSMLCSVASVPFRPVFGAFSPSMLRMAILGIPLYPAVRTVSSPREATAMLESMGQRDVLLMRGHGITVTGPTVEDATIRALQLEELARLMWEMACSGRQIPDIPADDIRRYGRVGRSAEPRTRWEGLPDAGRWEWKLYVKMLEVRNIGVPDDHG
ncbi:MAG: aldolase [Chloroflexi bacterium]|nr:aldolase [Chloroflexota bacterium]